MTVGELVKKLSEFSADAQVETYDEVENWVPLEEVKWTPSGKVHVF
jgi:hypothetical protein